MSDPDCPECGGEMEIAMLANSKGLVGWHCHACELFVPHEETEVADGKVSRGA